MIMKTQDIINELYKEYGYNENSIIYKACEKLAYLQNKLTNEQKK